MSYSSVHRIQNTSNISVINIHSYWQARLEDFRQSVKWFYFSSSPPLQLPPNPNAFRIFYRRANIFIINRPLDIFNPPPPKKRDFFAYWREFMLVSCLEDILPWHYISFFLFTLFFVVRVAESSMKRGLIKICKQCNLRLQSLCKNV